MSKLENTSSFVPLPFDFLLASVELLNSKQKQQLMNKLQSNDSPKKGKKMTTEEKEDHGMAMAMKEVDFDELVSRSVIMKKLNRK